METRLTWRRLRGEGSALPELHCEHKAKAEGEGETGQRPGWPPRPPPKTKQEKKPRATRTVFWIQYLVILDHTMRFIFKAAFCFMLSAQDSVSTVLGGHTCVHVSIEGRFRRRECSSPLVRLEVKREKQIQYRKWGNYISDCFANFLSFTLKRKITLI